MNTSVETPRCPQCGSPLPTNAPQGLCPRCLIAGVAAATESGNSIAPGDRTDAPSLPEIAHAFPQLEIVDLIGQGGMGAVYKARQPRLDRFVALKVLPKRLAREPNFRERFSREGRMLARLNHPNVVSVFDFGESGGFFYLLMEFVEGVNLRQAMRAGRFTLAQALKVVPEICGALSYAHGEGVLHRDIKPENILLDVRGRVKIADFGIAKLVGETDVALTATDATLGTPHYMAPEQVERPAEVDHRADIYSLGVVFYEMLTGELPLGHFAPPSERSPLDPRVDDVVMRALARERERRQQTAAQVKSEVETIATTAPVAPRSGAVSPVPPVTDAHANWSWKAVVAAIAAIPAWFIAFAGAGLLLSYQGVGNRSNWIGFLPAAVFSLVPIALVTWLGASALRDPQLRVGAKYGAWLAALSRQALPVVLIQAALSLLLGWIAPSIAPILVFLIIPAGFGIGLWLAEREHRSATGRSAAPLPRRFALVGAALYICLVLPVAAYFASGQRMNPSPARNAFSARSSLALPENAITLVAVAPHPSTEQTWWRADGSAATDGPFLNAGSRAVPQADERAYEFIFRSAADLPPGASAPTWKFEPPANWAGGGARLTTDPEKVLAGYHSVAASLPAHVRTVNIKAGLAIGRWETLLSCEARGGLTTSRSLDGENWTISFSDAVEASDGDLVLNVAHPRSSEWQTRVVAVNQTDEEIIPGRSSTFGNQSTYRFAGIRLAAVKEFRFQVRRYHWSEFRNVALHPSATKRGE